MVDLVFPVAAAAVINGLCLRWSLPDSSLFRLESTINFASILPIQSQLK